MNGVFFITGLPRSRTAWLAAWLTLGSVMCWHDKKFSPELVHKDRRTGFSGPELVDQFEVLSKQFPHAPWIVVLRNAEQAMAGFMRVAAGKFSPRFDIEKFWEQRCFRLANICEKPNVHPVRFDDLDSEHVARFVWDTCLPGIDFDRQRWELFNSLRICQK